MDLDTLWTAVLNELKLQMTNATFNTWLAGSRATAVAGDGTLTVQVRSDYAKDWLENRLYDTIMQTAVPMAVMMDQPPVTGLQFVVGAEFLLPADRPVYETAVSVPAQPAFPGFEPIRSNFVRVPRQFFEVVMADGPYVMRIFVGAVIANTYGKILNFRTMECAEWWTASRDAIRRETGIKSIASVNLAVKEARSRGYIIRRNGAATYRYRLRSENEPVDNPVDNSRKKAKKRAGGGDQKLIQYRSKIDPPGSKIDPI